MTKDEFLVQLERAASATEALPVTSAMVRSLAEALRKGEPPWWKAAAKAWEGRRFTAWTEAWGLFLTAVHFEALSDEENPLVPYFPSCGGTSEADPSGALAKFLAAAPASFYENLKNGQRRTFLKPRAALWISPALLFFQRERGLPFYLAQVDAGAGLDLAVDLVAPQKGFDSELVAERIGLDPAPLQVGDIGHRRWLTAGIFPDDAETIKDLDDAVEALLKREAKQAAFIQLAACPAAEAPVFLAQNVPASDPDVGLLVMNIGAASRMTDPEYASFKAAMSATLAPWGERGLWVEIESVRGELYSTTTQLRVHRLVDGALASHVMAAIDSGARKVDFDIDASAQFLAVK